MVESQTRTDRQIAKGREIILGVHRLRPPADMVGKGERIVGSERHGGIADAGFLRGVGISHGKAKKLCDGNP